MITYYDPNFIYRYNKRCLSQSAIGLMRILKGKIRFTHDLHQIGKPQYLICYANHFHQCFPVYKGRYVLIDTGLETIFPKEDYLRYKGYIKLVLFNGYCPMMFGFFKNNGIKYLHWPFLVDTKLFNSQKLEKKYMFVFAGVLHNKNIELLDELIFHFGQDKFYFIGPDFNRYGVYNIPNELNSKELNQIYNQSYFGINCFSGLQLGNNVNKAIHFNQRFFDLQATSCMQIVEYNKHMDIYFTDSELSKNVGFEYIKNRIEYFKNNWDKAQLYIKRANNRIFKEWCFEVQKHKLYEVLNVV